MTIEKNEKNENDQSGSGIRKSECELFNDNKSSEKGYLVIKVIKLIL